jgi:hypothetical protein
MLFFSGDDTGFLDSLTVTCMWRSRLRATFLSNRDEVDAGDEPTITLKTGYDIYRLLATGVYFSCLFINYLVLISCHCQCVKICPRSTDLFCFLWVGNS